MDAARQSQWRAIVRFMIDLHEGHPPWPYEHQFEPFNQNNLRRALQQRIRL
jgi:hypothetical protein